MKVWRACAGFRVPCQTLAERILVERLFTGNLSGRIPEVFTYYRQQLPDAAVEMAYLAENAYRYFVKHETADEQVFTCIGGYLLENKKMPPVCGMAYLKYHTAVWTGTAWRYTYAVTAKADGYAVCGKYFLFIL